VLAAALALVALAALIEAAMPELRARRAVSSLEEPWMLRLRRQMAEEPRRTRLAAVLLRALVLAVLFGCVALASPSARLPVALAAALGLALILLLGGLGWLRRDGWLRRIAAGIVAWPLVPCFLLLPRRDGGEAAARDAADSIADLTDALIAEPAERQAMVEALLGLVRRRVEDVMVPRSEIDAIDATAPWEEIATRLRVTAHTRLPLFDGELDRVHGIVHMRLVANELAAGRLTRERLRQIAERREALFAPEGTTLYEQLLRFRRLRRRIAFVVDEYGDLQGLVTLEDILEEVVGEFTTEALLPLGRIDLHADGSHVVPGALPLREINRLLGAVLPVDGPRTLSGLIVERLEAIPEPGAVLRVGAASIEVLQVAGNAVRTARLRILPSED
jgi:CBS domain containing-hemolysin-like protein